MRTACNSPREIVSVFGGDDFVVITTPADFEVVCQEIIKQFDEKAPTFYSDDDRKHGYIAGENRQGQKVNFPLASISIAVVTNQDRVINNHIEVGEIAAEIKEHAKAIVGSSMVVDLRHSDSPAHATEEEGKLINFPSKA